MLPDLTARPMTVFHMPGAHPGIYYLPPRPGWVLRPVQGAQVRLFGESDDDALRQLQQATCDSQQRRLLTTIMEINAAPVVLENAAFRNSLGLIGGRIWLNGASGARMRNKFDAANPEESKRDRLRWAFRHARENAKTPLPVWDKPAEDLPIALELRNGFNYYHFTTETLGSLAHFAGDAGRQPIRLHLPKDEVRGFVTAFIGAIFPEIADRVEFVASSRSYDHVRSVYNHSHYLYQVEDERIHATLAAEGVDPRWQPLYPGIPSRKSVAMASFDSNLRLLREHALRQVTQKLVARMPRLVWMGRDESGEARSRGITGERELMDGLAARGFANVAFEHLSPLEQIAQMQAADIVIAPHGAGLANMIYAKTGALVIEIGTRQTQLHRWGDFLPCAHVSGCRYDTVFADIAGVSVPGEVPAISEALLGVHIGERATRRILSLVDAALAGGRDA